MSTSVKSTNPAAPELTSTPYEPPVTVSSSTVDVVDPTTSNPTSVGDVIVMSSNSAAA